MKKKTILILLAVLVCLSGVVVRIWYVNQGREERVIKIYPMGEMAPFEDDFYHLSGEIREKYEIRVNSATVMPVEEYLKSKGLTMEEVWPEGNNITDILDVNITIRNNTSPDVDVENDKQFFDYFNADIENEGNSYQVDSELLWTLYPQINQGMFGFKIKPGTEYTMHLPYRVLDWQRTDSEKIKNSKNYMRMSQYPTKKLLEVKFDDDNAG